MVTGQLYRKYNMLIANLHVLTIRQELPTPLSEGIDNALAIAAFIPGNTHYKQREREELRDPTRVSEVYRMMSCSPLHTVY